MDTATEFNPADTAVPQTLAELVQHRVRLPGYYNALAARFLSDTAPDEFVAERVGIDESGHGVYVMFWRTPQAAQA